MSLALVPAQGLSRTRALAEIRVAGRMLAMTAPDVDGDGLADLVAVGVDGVVWWPGKAPGEFAATDSELLVDGERLRVGGTTDLPGCPLFADIDGDGVIDLAAVTPADAAAPPGDGRTPFRPSTPPLRWFRGLGGGRFAAPRPILAADGEPWQVPQGTTSLAIADWNGDGAQDLLVARHGTVWLFAGSAGGFATTATALPAAAHDIAVYDWDADGDLDLLTCDGATSVWWCENTGSKAAPALAAPALLVQVTGADVFAFAVVPLGLEGAGLITATRRDSETLPASGLSQEEAIQLELAEALQAQLEAKLRKLSELRPTDFTPTTLRVRQELRAEMESWLARPRQVARELRRKREPVPASFHFALHQR